MPDIQLVKNSKASRIPEDASHAFGSLGQLYLELLENKDKIKPELRHATYKPEIVPIREKEEWNWDNWKDDDYPKNIKQDDKEENDVNGTKNDLMDRDRNTDTDSDRDEDHDENHYEKRDDNYEGDNEGYTTKKEENEKRVTFDTDDFFSEDKSGERDEKRYDTDEDNGGSESVRLNNLLNGYNPPLQSNKPLFRSSRPPPTLAELNIKNAPGRNYAVDVSNVTKTHAEIEERKRVLLFNFKILKRKYPKGEVPEWTMHSDLEIMERSYDETLRLLALDSSISKNREYLEKGFVFGEQALLWFGVNNAQNFAAQEISNISKYESLLVELGEKQYESEFKSNLPVEVRIIGMILFQMISFIVSKSLFQKTGINHTKLPRDGDNTNVKMKGPELDLDL